MLAASCYSITESLKPQRTEYNAGAATSPDALLWCSPQALGRQPTVMTSSPSVSASTLSHRSFVGYFGPPLTLIYSLLKCKLLRNCLQLSVPQPNLVLVRGPQLRQTMVPLALAEQVVVGQPNNYGNNSMGSKMATSYDPLERRVESRSSVGAA